MATKSATEYEEIKSLCESIGYPEGKMTEKYLFTIDSVSSFYYKNEINKTNIRGGFTDGSGDGGIDFIYSDDSTMYLIQGKSSANLTVEDIKNLFTKMAETVSDFDENKDGKYSQILRSVYHNKYDDLDDNKNIELVLFTKTILSEDTRKQIENFSSKECMNDYIITMYDANDIALKKASLFQQKDLIKEDSVQLYLGNDGTKNILHYGESGIIVNIKATSLKNLYAKHIKDGLFSYNLREHIKQKSVDQGIENTIKNNFEKFWFYNNGIIIGCKEFKIDGNKIKPYDFSIINGAQTTTQIGKSKIIDNNHDFAIVCKIVRAKDSVRDDTDFIGKISEASNSQKPIKPRDLKSNSIEQKRLQAEAAQNKNPLAIEIKRGVKIPNCKKLEKWQHVTNDYIGQLIYSCIFQHPGPARNSKNSMYSSIKVYNQLFMREHDYDCLYDLVRLGNIYDTFLEQDTNMDIEKSALARNGKFTVLATLLYLYKKSKGIVDCATSDALHKDNIKGLLITDYPGDDLDERLYEFFAFIIREIHRLYEQKKNSEKITSYSNFFKSEKLYEMILINFDELEKDKYDKDKIAHHLEVFTKKK